MLNLYLICFTDDDGSNFDQFVRAKTTQEAVEIWRQGMKDDIFDEAEYTPGNVFRINPFAPRGVLDWGNKNVKMCEDWT